MDEMEKAFRDGGYSTLAGIKAERKRDGDYIVFLFWAHGKPLRVALPIVMSDEVRAVFPLSE